MVQDMSRQMKISLRKQIFENSVKHQIHQIKHITRSNGKIEYCGRTYAKNEVVLEPGCISDAFEFRAPVFYKLATPVTCDDDSENIYTVHVGRCYQQTSFEEYKYEEKHKNTLIVPG